MKISDAIVYTALLLSMGCCTVGIDGCGGGRSSLISDGLVIVDGTKLTHHRQIVVEGSLPGGMLNLALDSGDIEVVVGETTSIQLTIYEKEPGDAVVKIESDEVVVESKGGFPTYLSDARAFVPGDVSLNLETGSGDVSVEGMVDSESIRIDTGSGDVRIKRLSEVKNLCVNTGSGDVELRDVRVDDVDIDTGSGHVMVSDSRLKILVVDTGSGDIHLHNTSCESSDFDTGSGEVTHSSDDEDI